MTNERRGAVRWNVVLPVRYIAVTRHTESSARTQDLSTTGAKLVMVEKHRPGDRLNMILEIPGSEKGGICVEADVAWQCVPEDLEEECNYLSGIVFRRIRDCHKTTILDYISVACPGQFRKNWWAGV